MKKIILNQNNLKNISEEREQLEIPFDGDGKYNYLHFIDWIESIGKYGRLNPVKEDLAQELIYDEMDDGIDYFEQMSDDYDEENKREAAIEYISNLSDEEKEDQLKIPYDEIDDDTYYYDMFNDYGMEEFQSFYKNKLEEMLDENLNIQTDNRNLIYVEREITIPPLYNKDFKYAFSTHKDFFRFLNDSYADNIGQYWSFEKDISDSYNGISYGGKYAKIRFIGFVSPTSVDWKETIYRNLYSLYEEKELFIDYNELVEVDEIIELEHHRRLPLKGPILLHV